MLIWIIHWTFNNRLFDKNYDGYIDKKEFKWMTTSEIISNRTINIVFEASWHFNSIWRKNLSLLLFRGVIQMEMENWIMMNSKPWFSDTRRGKKMRLQRRRINSGNWGRNQNLRKWARQRVREEKENPQQRNKFFYKINFMLQGRTQCNIKVCTVL